MNSIFIFCRKMVDKPEVITNEDFEYIVQAERQFGPSLSVVEDTFDDVTDGNRQTIDGSFNDTDILRNVTFNQEDDVCIIENK